MYDKIAIMISGAGLLTFLVTTLLYFMKLSIFSQESTDWIFLFGLVFAAVAALPLLSQMYKIKVKQNG